jgi:hypothetical protein
MISCPSKVRSVPRCHAVSVWRKEKLETCRWFLKLILFAFQSQQISQDQLPFEGTIRLQLPCYFSVAECTFWRLLAGLCRVGGTCV